MMGFIHVFVAVLSVLSVGQSAPTTTCESLIQPIEIQGRDQLVGQWTLFGESTDIPRSKDITDMFVENVWVKLTAAEQSDTLEVNQFQKMSGQCFKMRNKMRLENNMLSMDLFNSTTRFLSTGCPDCLVSFSQYEIGLSSFKGVQLLSTRTKVSDAELEEFKKQVECLSLPPPAILNQNKDPCSDDSSATDLTADLNGVFPKVLSLLERLLRNEGLMNMLISLMPGFDGIGGTGGTGGTGGN